jgi:hypothetical protein
VPHHRHVRFVQLTLGSAAMTASMATCLRSSSAPSRMKGPADGPVTLASRSVGTGLELSVENAGRPIPPRAIARRFEPFARAAADGRLA